MGSVLGFTIKSGWACAVVLDGSVRSPQVVVSRRIELSDPADVYGRQPYHAAAGTARKPGAQLDTLIASVEKFGRQSVAEFLQQQDGAGGQLDGAAIVVGSLIDPATIANDHIRIHALEGQLFRGIVEKAVERRKLTPAIWRERDLYEVAATRLNRSEAEIRQAVTGFGRAVSGPWRAEQKAAAVAAWLLLANKTALQRPGATNFK